MRPARKPPTNATLLLIGGPVGSGKSTLTRALSAASGVPFLDKDTMKSSLLDLGASPELASRASYETLLAMAADLLRVGIPVILDAPGKYATFIAACERTCRETRSDFRCIVCQAEHSTRQTRVRDRHAVRSQVTEIESAQQDTMNDWLSVFPPHARLLSTESDLGALVSDVMIWLDWSAK
jgi:predicted kinase